MYKRYICSILQQKLLIWAGLYFYKEIYKEIYKYIKKYAKIFKYKL
jgi:hypothetical protein